MVKGVDEKKTDILFIGVHDKHIENNNPIILHKIKIFKNDETSLEWENMGEICDAEKEISAFSWSREQASLLIFKNNESEWSVEEILFNFKLSKFEYKKKKWLIEGLESTDSVEICPFKSTEENNLYLSSGPKKELNLLYNPNQYRTPLILKNFIFGIKFSRSLKIK